MLIYLIVLAIGIFIAWQLQWFTGKKPLALERSNESVEDPYRGILNAPIEHDVDCEACSQLKRRGLYLPPEVILEAGYPVACVVLCLGISEEDLDRLAKSAGLVRIQ